MNKLEKFLRMDDFDLTNDFFYYDLIAGLTELLIAFDKYNKDKIAFEQSNNAPQAANQEPDNTEVTFVSLKNFCAEFVVKNPILKMTLKYLFEDNLCTIRFLESQNFGNFELNQSLHKLTAPLNFTTNACYYAPDIIGHTANIETLRGWDKDALKLLWTTNESSLPGHCHPQDQCLEATMNCAVKNDVKIFTTSNVTTRAATVQNREDTSKNLKDELFIPPGVNLSISKKVNITSILNLRALWRKYFNSTIQFSPQQDANNTVTAADSTVHALHNKDKLLNQDLENETEKRTDMVENCIKVKVQQKGGWTYANPPVTECRPQRKPQQEDSRKASSAISRKGLMS